MRQAWVLTVSVQPLQHGFTNLSPAMGFFCWTPGLFWLQGHRAAPGRVEHLCLSYRTVLSVNQHLAQELVLLFIQVCIFIP